VTPEKFESLKKLGEKLGIAIRRFDPTSQGLGDVVAKATKAVNIKPCKKCQKRQAVLNQLIPFKGEPNALRMQQGTDGSPSKG
jgi:hypothetical protein